MPTSSTFCHIRIPKYLPTYLLTLNHSYKCDRLKLTLALEVNAASKAFKQQRKKGTFLFYYWM